MTAIKSIEVIEVWMHGEKVGRIAMTPQHLCAFEYDPHFLATGFSISPYHLPLRSGVFMAKRTPFNGGFGVFDDSLPDGWGRLILDRYLKEKGVDSFKISILQRLALIGSRGRGALEYLPDLSSATEEEILDFDKIAADTHRILTSDDPHSSVKTLYQYGGSSGGVRPKIFITIDGREWLIKFKATMDREDIGITEYQYSVLAKECGIRMAKTKLFQDKYFGVERFDRVDGQKIHTISAAGLLNANYREPSLDYSDLLKVTLNLTKNMEEVYDLFRIMLFNVAIRNRDDHAKNFSFQLIDGQWRLSPAYDLLPSEGFNGFHTTTINNTGDPTTKDIITVAEQLSLDKQRVDRMMGIISSKTAYNW